MLIPQKFVVGDCPRTEFPSSALTLLGMDAAMAAPFATCEFGLADDLGKFLSRVPVFHRLLVKERGEGDLDTVKTFDDFLHGGTLESRASAPFAILLIGGLLRVFLSGLVGI